MLFLIFTTNAYALGIRSIANCGVDYFKFCSQYPVGSDEVRECFRMNGHSLSDICVDALLADGEVTKEEVDGERDKIKEEVKPVEEPVKPKEEEITIAKPETKPEFPIIISEEPKVVKKTEPEKVKSSILQYIAKRVAAKLKEPVTKTETIAAIIEKPSRKRKVQRGGKWDGFPLYLDWKSNRNEIGGEITPYGLEDRRQHLTNAEENDNIYNERRVWVVLYKDELHNQTGPDWEVAYVFQTEIKASAWLSQFAPDYVSQHFKVVKSRIY